MANDVKKKFLVIKYNDKPIYVAPVLEGSLADYQEKVVEARKNLKDYEISFNNLLEKVSQLEQEIKHLKGED